MDNFRSDREIGEYVRRLRTEAGETQGDLAAALGLDQSAVSKIEGGTRALGGREALLIGERYGVAGADLLRREPEMAMLRAGDAELPAVKHALDLFRQRIEHYFGLRVMVG